jgi:ferric-dicitrate binding protein FerR (iron transport regulator)
MMTRRRLLSLLLAATALGAATLVAAQAPARDASSGPVVETTAGQVEVRAEGARAWRPVTAGAALRPGDTLRTGVASKAKIVHAGGVIWLFDRTVLRLPAGSGPAVRRPELLSGQSLFEVDGARLRALLPGGGTLFEAVTPHIVAGVKGTAFLLVERGDDSYVCVLSGSVEAAGRAGGPARAVRLDRGGVADFKGGRFETSAVLDGQDAWADWVIGEAGRFAYEEMVRDGRLAPR